MTDIDVAGLRAEWAGWEFPTMTFEIHQARLLDWAVACGETDPRFVDPDHPDFQAHPNFAAGLGTGPLLPEGFPPIGDGYGIDGGKTVAIHGPVRPGDTLTGRASIHDVYDKTGRSGTMVFIVHRMELTNAAGEPVATVDSKMIQAIG